MPLHRAPLGRAAVLPLLLAACAPDDQILDPNPVFQSTPSFADRTDAPIPFLASNRPRGCTDSRYRQFNFWVGRWEVQDPSGVVGTNRVRSALAGCAVTEEWIASNGFPGRSLNSYDAETNAWHQFWVDGGAGSLMLEGGATPSGGMMLSQTRPIRFNGPLATDRLEWKRQEGGRVLQTWDQSTDQGATFQRLFEGTYIRSGLPAATPAPTGLCADPARLRFHRFDFTVGVWVVSRASSGARVGRSTIAKDLGDCLLEEQFEGPRDHRVIGFGALDIVAFNWYREYVTSQGVRVALRGDLSPAGQMTMTGRIGSSLIRVTWIGDGVHRFEQQWERSIDGGTTYDLMDTLIYQRAN